VLRHEAGAGQGSLTQVGTGQGRTRQLNALALADAAVAAALVAGRVDLAAPAAPRAGRHLQAAAAAAHSSQGAGPRQVSAAAGAFASSSPWQLRHVIGSAPTPEQAPLPPPPSSAPPSLPNRLSSAQPSCHRCCPHPRTYWNTPSGVRLRLHDLAAAAAAAAVWGGGGRARLVARALACAALHLHSHGEGQRSVIDCCCGVCVQHGKDGA